VDGTTATSPPSPGRADRRLAPDVLAAVLRRDRVVTLAGLVVVVALGWLYLARVAGGTHGMTGMEGMDMPPEPWTGADAVLAFAMWAVMMPAMMLPSAAPMMAPPVAAAPVATAPQPTAGEPQWDAARNAYIQWDGVNERWMQYDQTAGAWKPIE